jgi:RNA polymerase sigma factor (sigma-70 family)
VVDISAGTATERAVDAMLVRQALAGSSRAVEDLFRHHWGTAIQAAWAFAKTPADAEDAAAEGFALAVAHLPTLRNPASFRPYLQRCVGNAARAILRRSGRVLPVGLALDEDRWAECCADWPVEAAYAAEDTRRAMTAFRTLASRQQAVLWLRHVDLRPLSAVAEHFGLCPNAASQLDSRGRRALRRQYMREDDAA